MTKEAIKPSHWAISDATIPSQYMNNARIITNDEYYKIGAEVQSEKRNDSVDNKFYGHFLPNHFKKTRIISTNGR